MAELSEEEQKLAGWIFSIMLAVGAAIYLAQKMFPFFLVGSTILFVLLIIVGLIEFFFRDHSYLDVWDYISTYVGAGLAIFLVCTGITYAIGYGLGGTSLGQASLQVYNAMAGVDQQLQDSINLVVEENCKTLPVESCQLLRTNAKTAQTLQEVSDYAEKLQTAQKVVNKLSDQKG